MRLISLLNYKRIRVLLLIVVFFSCKEQGEEEIYYLNKETIGVFVVFWNQNDGQMSKRINKKRIYNVPRSTIKGNHDIISKC